MKTKLFLLPKIFWGLAILGTFIRPAFGFDGEQAKIQLDSLTKLVSGGDYDSPRSLFVELYDLGRDFDYYLKDYELAAKSFLSAQDIVGAFPQEIPFSKEIGLYKNLGKALILLGDFEDGMASFENGWDFVKGNEIREREDFDEVEFLEYKADFLNNWGKMERVYGNNMVKAQEISLLAWAAYQEFMNNISGKRKTQNLSYYAMAAKELGIVYEELGELDKAESYYQQALTIINQKGTLYPSEVEAKGQIMFDLASYYIEAGKLKASEKLFLLLLNSPQYSKYGKINAHNNLGILFKKKGDFGQAHFHLNKARSLIAEDGRHQQMVFDNLGDTFFEQGMLDSALFSYHKAIASRLQDSGFSLTVTPQSYPDFSTTNIRYFLRSVGSKANVLAQMAVKNPAEDELFLQSALSTYNYAFNLIDSLQKQSLDKDFQVFLKKEVYTIYEGAIATALLLEDNHLAFEVASRAKATFLLSSLNRLNVKDFFGVEPKILQRERLLRQQISRFANSDDKSNLLSSTSELNNLVKELSTNPYYRKYYNSRFRGNLCQINDIQEAIPDSTSIVQYFVGKKKAFAFHLTSKSLEVREFDYDENQIDEYFNLIKKESGLKIPVFNAKYQPLANDLYKNLLGNFQEDIQTNLIIIPDGKLAYLPFDALLVSRNENANTLADAKLDYVVLHHSISIQLSACDWLDKEKALKNTTSVNSSWNMKAVLAFAPAFEVFGINDIEKEDRSFLQNDIFAPQLSELIPLDGMGNELEIEVLEEVIRLKPYKDKRALLGRFFKEAGKYKIIHLATHGEYSDISQKSRIIFTMVNDDVDNEYLYPAMLYALSLKASLVVLSACETMYGEENRGEGITSMAYAFSYAGAKSTIATLWKVNSQANRSIMKAFYEYSKKGYGKDKALQKAKIDYLNKGLKIQPHFWAAPVLTGNTAPIDFSASIPLYSLLTLGGIFLLLIIFIVVRRRDRKVEKQLEKENENVS